MVIALTSMDPVWEDVEKNLSRCRLLCQRAKEAGADLIVFPEMALTGFTMNREALPCAASLSPADLEKESSITALCQTSLSLGLCILTGLAVKTKEGSYNLACLIREGRVIEVYVKQHPFLPAFEDLYYEAGRRPFCTSLEGWTIGGGICFDLRFPEVFSSGAEVLFVPANWPLSRLYAWKTLLAARAIENQAYVIGVNRRGEGGGCQYGPSSCAFGPEGEALTLCPVKGAEEDLCTVTIDSRRVREVRRAFPMKRKN